MEKLIYVLWSENRPAGAFNAAIMGNVREALLARGAERLQLNIIDAAVAPGASLTAGTIRPLPAGMISFWLPSSHARGPFEAIIASAVPRFAGYSVVESTVLPNSETSPDDRVRGFSQLAFFSKASFITPEGFRERWMRDHTRNAVETQETFHYAQNIVVRPLTPGAPVWDGIVEECYPEAAMTDPLVYWKAGGSEAQRAANYEREIASVLRFADLDNLALIVTSAYRCGGWTDQAIMPEWISDQK